MLVKRHQACRAALRGWWNESWEWAQQDPSTRRPRLEALCAEVEALVKRAFEDGPGNGNASAALTATSSEAVPKPGKKGYSLYYQNRELAHRHQAAWRELRVALKAAWDAAWDEAAKSNSSPEQVKKLEGQIARLGEFANELETGEVSIITDPPLIKRHQAGQPALRAWWNESWEHLEALCAEVEALCAEVAILESSESLSKSSKSIIQPSR